MTTHFSRIDTRNAFLLFLWTLLLQGIGLGALEYFRHTEADRTLIAWEMLESGNWLVPHLLGSPILTKPPLFYWAIATSMEFFGGHAEWIARVPSMLSGAFLVLSQYVFMRFAGGTREVSVFVSLVLSTSMQFCMLGTLAEIDMLYAFFSALSLFGLYLGFAQESFWMTLFAYFCLALAFLTKGPPTVVFFGVSLVFFGIWFFLENHTSFFSIRRILLRHLVAACMFVALVGLWIFCLSREVGWAELVYQFQVEILDRAFAGDGGGRARGPFFYIGSLLIGTLPWCLLALPAVVLLWRGHGSSLKKEFGREGALRSLIVFHIIVVFTAFITLSFADGKSNRYLFPVFAFSSGLSAFGVFSVFRSPYRARFFILGKYMFLILGGGLLGASSVIELEGVSQEVFFLVGVCFFLVLSFMSFSCRQEQARALLAGFFVFMLVLRVGYKEVYVEHRNVTRGVRSAAEAIHRELPRGAPLYTLEMFQRWTVYYLKRSGRDIYRLSPALLKTSGALPERVYLLLDEEAEGWRLRELQAYDETLVVHRRFSQKYNNLLLVNAAREALLPLAPKYRIPTNTSPPYYEGLSYYGFQL